MARCVLAVLDDFHCRSAPPAPRAARSLSSDGREAPGAASHGGAGGLSPFHHPHDIFQDLRRQHQQQQHFLQSYQQHLHPMDDTTSESSYDSASDYHLYEEILYEATTASKPPQSVPPPLPARPPHLFRGGQQPLDAHSPVQPLKQQQEQQQQPRPQQPLPPSSSSQRQQQQPQQEVQTQQKQAGSHPVSPKHVDSQQQQSPQSPGAAKPAPPPKPPKPARPAGPGVAGKPVPPPKPPSAALPSPAITVTPPAPSGASQQQAKGSSSKSAPQASKDKPGQKEQEQQKGGEGATALKPPTNKPKQRSNLYSIFRDRDHRRCLSASLQQEYHQQDYHADTQPPHPASAPATCASLAAADDDYGFKVVPHVV